MANVEPILMKSVFFHLKPTMESCIIIAKETNGTGVPQESMIQDMQ